MLGLVLELRRDAIDRSTSVADLLRKALVVARKLALDEFARWIDLELNGYGEDYVGGMPPHRVQSGETRAWNPYHGWLPIFFPEEAAELAERLRRRPCGQSIAELESLISSQTGRRLHSHAVSA